MKMKKQLFLSAVCMLLLAVCLSCEKESDLHLSTNTSLLEFSYIGGTQSINISSGGVWNISGLPSWISADVVKGTGNGSVHFTASNNPNDSDRSGSIIIFTNDGNENYSITIKQQGTHVSPIKIDDANERVFGGRTSIYYEDSINVSCDTSWKIYGPSWVSASFNEQPLDMTGKEEYKGSGVIRLAVSEKYDGEDSRQDVITIRTVSGENTMQIPIRQLGKNELYCYDTFLTKDAFACQIKVGTNIEKYVILLSDVARDVSYNDFNAGGTVVSAHIDNDYNGWFYFTDYPFQTNKNYTLYFIGISANNNYAPLSKLNKLNLHSHSDTEILPEVVIKDVKKNRGLWEWTVVPNKHTKMYITSYVNDKTLIQGMSLSQVGLLYAYQTMYYGASGLVSDIERKFTIEDSFRYEILDDIVIIAMPFNVNFNGSNIDVFPCNVDVYISGNGDTTFSPNTMDASPSMIIARINSNNKFLSINH